MKKPLVLLLVTALLVMGVLHLLGDDEITGETPYDGTSYLEDTGPAGSTVDVDPGGTDDNPLGTADGTPGTDEAGRDGVAARTELVGRVLDAGRRPIQDVRVELLWSGRVLRRATTDAEGIYRFQFKAPATGHSVRATLRATKDGLGGASTEAWLARAGLLHVAPMILRTAHPLQVVAMADGKPAAFARVVVALRGGGTLTPFGEQPADSSGLARFGGLAAGLYEVFATLPGRGRGVATVRLPQPKDTQATIELGAERILDILVADARTGRPVEGATVQIGDPKTLPTPTGPGYLPALRLPTTNASGRVTVRGIGADETIYANANAAGYLPAVWWRARGQVARPGSDEVRIALQKPRMVVFPVQAGDVTAPGDMEVLRVELSQSASREGPLKATAYMEGTYVHVEGLPQGECRGVLTAPDGAQARFQAPASANEGPAVQFVAARSVRVRVQEPDGTPVPDLALRLRSLEALAKVEPATTDGEGVAEFHGVAGSKAGVHRLLPGSPWGGPLVGQIDLSTGAEEYTLELQPQFHVTLRIEVDGEPRLPTAYQLHLANTQVPSDAIVEDPDAGVLALSMRPPVLEGTAELKILARGFLSETVTVEDGDDTTITLRTAGTIIARVTKPKDGPYALALERLDPETSAWIAAARGSPGPGAVPAASLDGVHAFEGLAAGRYRLVEARSGFQSAPIDVVLGADPRTVPVDLSTAEQVEGRVTAPAGTDFRQARVLITGRHKAANAYTGIRVGADGAFRFHALRGTRIEARVTHPLLMAKAPVSLTAGSGALRLVLEAGPEVVFRVDGAVGTAGIGGSSLEVKLYRDRIGGTLVRAVRPVVQGDAYRFGGIAPGTYAIWIGLGRAHAPYTRTGVVLGRGRTDLGTLKTSAGGSLVVEVQGRSAGAQTIWAEVNHLGEPAYRRHASGRVGAGPLVVPGLGKGRFRVRVRASGRSGTRVLLDRAMAINGSGEQRISVDLR